MRKLWLAGVVVLGVALGAAVRAQQAPSPAGPAPPGAVRAGGPETMLPPDKGDQILKDTIQALGGEAFLNVQDITRRGRLYSFSRGELASAGDRFVDYVKFPGKERLELGKKGNIVYLNDNDKGWELDRQGIREQSPEQVKDFNQGNLRDLDYLLRFRLQKEKFQAYYQDSIFVDNRRADVLELVDENGESTTLVVDHRRHLPVQVRYRQKDELSGDYVDILEVYGKYITVQGVTVPMQVTRDRAGTRVLEAHLDEVQFNTGLSDQLFTRASLEERWQKVK